MNVIPQYPVADKNALLQFRKRYWSNFAGFEFNLECIYDGFHPAKASDFDCYPYPEQIGTDYCFMVSDLTDHTPESQISCLPAALITAFDQIVFENQMQIWCLPSFFDYAGDALATYESPTSSETGREIFNRFSRGQINAIVEMTTFISDALCFELGQDGNEEFFGTIDRARGKADALLKLMKE